MVHAQLILGLAGDRLQLGLRTARANHKKVGESGKTAQVEDDKILRFFREGGLGAEECQLFAGQRAGRGHGIG